MITKKMYIKLADAIYEWKEESNIDEDTLMSLTRYLGMVFKQDNPLFSRELFFIRCVDGPRRTKMK